MLDVQEALRRLRGAGVTQSEIAREIGVSQQTVSIWEREGLPPRFDVPLRTVQVLERRLAELDQSNDPPTAAQPLDAIDNPEAS